MSIMSGDQTGQQEASWTHAGSPITGPWETLHMDLMGPYVKSHPGGYTYLLVVIDDFTKWTEVFALRCKGRKDC
jgi:hypothetical protein